MPELGPVRVFYGNYEFIPSPIFNWNRDLVRDNKGDQVFVRNTLDFNGDLLRVATGSQEEFIPVWDQINQLRDALGSGNQEFKITHNGLPLLSGIFPRIQGPVIDQGVWADQAQYSFTLDYDEQFEQGDIISYTDTWAFQENDDRRTVAVSHSISAVGADTSGSGISNAFTNARVFVLGRTGFANAPIGSPFFAQVSGMSNAYEELRSENADVQGGAYSVQEQFTLASGTFLEQRTGDFDQDEEGVVTVTINGDLQGLGRGDTAFTNAINGFQSDIKPKLPSIASGIYSQFGGDATLFTTNPRSFSVTRNAFGGTIQYSISFTDSESDNLPSGIQEFSINVVNNKPTRAFALFPIIEDPNGPLLQDIQTTNEGTFSITGSARGKAGFMFADLKSFVQNKINNNLPTAIGARHIFKNQEQITEDEDNNTIQFNISWTYTTELNNAPNNLTVILD